MKKIITLIAFSILFFSSAQAYPLRTFTEIPENAYLKDTNNELPDYEGMWKGIWNNKTIFIAFKKVTNQYNDVLKYNKDFLIAKFKVIDNNDIVLYDNTALPDHKAKIKGSGFRKKDDTYSLGYSDSDMCDRNGCITIQFTDSTKTKLEWKFSEGEVMIDSSCFYNGQTWPEILPQNILLVKQ